MDRVELVDKHLLFMSKYAAPSVLTGYFVAAIVESDRRSVEEAFTDPGRILVENVDDLYAPKTYEGYTRINEIREQENEIIVILERG